MMIENIIVSRLESTISVLYAFGRVQVLRGGHIDFDWEGVITK
jgi:hypothetical protein